MKFVIAMDIVPLCSEWCWKCIHSNKIIKSVELINIFFHVTLCKNSNENLILSWLMKTYRHTHDTHTPDMIINTNNERCPGMFTSIAGDFSKFWQDNTQHVFIRNAPDNAYYCAVYKQREKKIHWRNSIIHPLSLKKKEQEDNDTKARD